MIKKCDNCKIEFDKNRPHQRFCKPQCRWQYFSTNKPRIRLKDLCTNCLKKIKKSVDNA